MGIRARVALVVSALLAAAIGTAAAEGRDANRLAAAAIELCKQAEKVPIDEQRALVQRGLTLAEHALELDDQNGRAHFAVFCTLGRLVDIDGIGWRTLGDVRRVRESAERAVALAPDDVDAWVGRGILLLRLPSLLGGDHQEAEECLLRALRLDPWHARARAYLARLRDERAAGGAALSSARRAE